MAKPLSYQDFLTRVKAKHPEAGYLYPATAPEGFETRANIRVECPEHGEFFPVVNLHLRGSGCPRCASLRIGQKKRVAYADFIASATETHGGRYDYSKISPEGFRSNGLSVTITCPVHGDFQQEVAKHLRGFGCKKCAVGVYTREGLRAALEAKHAGRYRLLSEIPENPEVSQLVLRLECPEHGEFTQLARNHLAGRGCFHCGRIASGLKLRKSFEEVAAEVRALHGGKYRLVTDPCELTGIFTPLELFCTETFFDGRPHGIFPTTPHGITQGHGCPSCARKRSGAEDAVRDFVASLGFETLKGSEDVLPGLGRKEVDILIPAAKLAIEYNGLIWHSERFKLSKSAHLEKTELLASLGYRLIQIFEDEWLEKREIVESRLRAALGQDLSKTHARKTKVVSLEFKEAAGFLAKTHIQGAGPSAPVCLGLSLDNEVVAVATFGRARFGEEGWELLRFSSVGRVVGGASKLLAHFEREFAKSGDRLISFCDRRWGTGQVYSALGFDFKGNTAPGYFYTRASARFSREKFQKHKLPKILKTFDETLTEVENCRNNGFSRVWDCGHAKFSKIVGAVK